MSTEDDMKSGRINLSESGRIRKARRANLAEDLRSPIRAILLYTRRMRELAEKTDKGDLLSDLEKISGGARQFRAGLEELFARASQEDVTIDVTLRALDSQARHDLRTPLNHIIGYSEMLLEDAEEQQDSDLGDGLQKVCGWGRRILKLFNRLTADLEDGQSADNQAAEDTVQVIEHLMQTVQPLPDDDPSRKDRKDGSILVADDNDINRDLLCQQVVRQGHRVQQVSNGKEALEALREGDFDVLLLDVIMPELNGVEVLQQIRADEQLRHIPVIMLSALDELNSVARCIEIGAEDFIQKPYEWALLRARIEAAIEKKRLRDREVLYIQQIDEERKLSDRLLRVILPDQIIAELKTTETVRPRRHDNVAVLFTDIVGFTRYCDQHEPEEVVGQLQGLIEAWEVLAENLSIHKVKTIGDAFMASAGLLIEVENPVRSCLDLGLGMLESIREIAGHWDIRSGIHVGPVVAGLLGKQQYLFDIWGDTVNIAARVVSNADPGRIALSMDAWESIADQALGDRRTVELKGKGVTDIMLFREFLPG